MKNVNWKFKLTFAAVLGTMVAVIVGVIMTLIRFKGKISMQAYFSTLGKGSYWLLLFVVFVAIGTWFLAEHRIRADKDVVKDNEGETSELMSISDIKKSKDFVVADFSDLTNIKDGIVLQARKAKNNIKVVMSSKPNHVLVIGTTGAGKTQGFINPTIQVLMQTKTKPSVVITDPKGELFDTHAAAFLQKGYKVLELDLDQPYYSSKWNPFDVLRERIDKINKLNVDGDSEETKVKIQILRDEIYELAKDLTDAICPLEKSSDMGWQLGARSLVNAIVLALCEDYEDGLFESKQFGFATLYHIVFDYLSADDTVLKDYLYESRDLNSKVKGLAKQVLETQEKTLTSYLSEVYKHVEWLSDSGILSMTSGSDIDLYSMDEQPTALFLKIPDEKKTRHRLVTLLITQMYKTLVDKTKRNKASGETEELELKRTVYFLLDEFGNLPAFNDLAGMITVGRSRRMFFEMVVQNYAQLANKYGKEVADIVKSQCGTKIFLGSDDANTINEFSSICGKKIVANSNITTSYQQNSASTGTGVKEIPLIYPTELKNLNSGDSFGNAVVLPFGHFAFKSKYTPSYQCSKIYIMKAPPQSLKQAHYYDEMDHVFDITSKIARDNAIREEMKKMEDELRAMQEQQQAKKPSAMSSANKSDILLEQVNVLKQFLPEEMADFETLDLDTQLAKLAELKSKAGSMELIFKITDLEIRLKNSEVKTNDK